MGEVTAIGSAPTARAEESTQPDPSTGTAAGLEARIEDVFVGRDEALARLHQAWANTQASAGRMALISGSAKLECSEA